MALPDNACKYAETPEFTVQTVPERLTHMHDTKPGVWGRICVLAGSLDYALEGGDPAPQRIVQGGYAIIEPTVRHKVTLTPDARFKVEFYRVTE